MKVVKYILHVYICITYIIAYTENLQTRNYPLRGSFLKDARQNSFIIFYRFGIYPNVFRLMNIFSIL